MRFVALLLLAIVAGCDDETVVAGAPLGWGPASGSLYSPPASEGSGIVGDWLYCQDPSCAEPTWNGLRFAADDTLSGVWVTDQDLSGLTYCVGEPMNRYTWTGGTLTIYDLRGSFTASCDLTLAGEIAHLSCLDEDSYLVRVSGRVEPSCPLIYD